MQITLILREDFYENQYVRIHFEKYLIRDSRQFMIFKEYFIKSVGTRAIFRRIIKSDMTDGQTD